MKDIFMVRLIFGKAVIKQTVFDKNLDNRLKWS